MKYIYLTNSKKNALSPSLFASLWHRVSPLCELFSQLQNQSKCDSKFCITAELSLPMVCVVIPYERSCWINLLHGVSWAVSSHHVVKWVCLCQCNVFLCECAWLDNWLQYESIRVFSIYLFIYLSVSMSVLMSACLSARLPACLNLCI